MKLKIVTLVLTLFLTFTFFCCTSQKTEWDGTIEEVDGVLNISNPNKPLSNKAGRVLQLEEVIRIRDDGKQIVFKAPYGLQIGADGSFNFYDNWQLYKFDNNGRFVFRIIKQGQGPGEATRRTSFFLTNEEIIVQAINPPKVMWFDLEGNYKGEKKTYVVHNFMFVGFLNNKVFGFLDEILHDKLGKEGYVDFPTILYEITPDFTSLNKLVSFPVKHYVVPGAWWPRARLDYALKDSQNLFISHTGEYQIVKYNIERGQVEKSFTRKYDRIKYPPPKKREHPPGTLTPPPYDFYYDIAKLLIYKEKLWVITSTRDKHNRRLVDVYNIEGEYEDNFYLDFPEDINPRNYAYGTIASMGEYIYTIDEHKDGYFSIAKYQIVDKN